MEVQELAQVRHMRDARGTREELAVGERGIVGEHLARRERRQCVAVQRVDRVALPSRDERRVGARKMRLRIRAAVAQCRRHEHLAAEPLARPAHDERRQNGGERDTYGTEQREEDPDVGTRCPAEEPVRERAADRDEGETGGTDLLLLQELAQPRVGSLTRGSTRGSLRRDHGRVEVYERRIRIGARDAIGERRVAHGEDRAIREPDGCGAAEQLLGDAPARVALHSRLLARRGDQRAGFAQPRCIRREAQLVRARARGKARGDDQRDERRRDQAPSAARATGRRDQAPRGSASAESARSNASRRTRRS